MARDDEITFICTHPVSGELVCRLLDRMASITSADVRRLVDARPDLAGDETLSGNGTWIKRRLGSPGWAEVVASFTQSRVVLHQAVRSSQLRVAVAAAANPALAAADADWAWTNGPEAVQCELVGRNENCPDAILDVAAQRPSKISCLVAARGDLTQGRVDLLIDQGVAVTLRALAENTTVAPAMLRAVRAPGDAAWIAGARLGLATWGEDPEPWELFDGLAQGWQRTVGELVDAVQHLRSSA